MTNFLEIANALEADWNSGYRVRTVKALRHASLMKSYLLFEAICPCCEEQEKCASDCTFATDEPGDAARMAAIRAVLGAAI